MTIRESDLANDLSRMVQITADWPQVTLTAASSTTDPPTHLGGHGVNRIPLDSAYGKLPRLNHLPTECPFEFPPKYCEILTQFWTGELAIRFDVAPAEKGDIESWSLLAGPSHDCPLVYLELMREYSHERTRSVVFLTTFPYRSTVEGELVNVLEGLDVDQMNIIGGRMLHHLLREEGHRLNEKARAMIQEILDTIYYKSKWFSLKLDLLVTQADIWCNTDDVHPKMVGRTMLQVGELLEATGQFEVAAPIYTQAAKDFMPHDLEKSQFYAFAGLAYKRASMPRQAQEQYVLALHKKYWGMQERGQAFDLNDDETSLLYNLINFYNDALVRGFDLVEGHPAHVTSPFTQVLIALLYYAGWNRTGEPRMDPFISGNGKMAQAVLKRSFQKTVKAKQVLIEAVKLGTVFHFQNEILNARKTTAPAFGASLPVGCAPNRNPHKSSMKAAKDHIRSASHYSVPLRKQCHNCYKRASSDNGPLMNCPCKMVFYCRKECQTSDWKDHKKICQWHQAKMEAKKNCK